MIRKSISDHHSEFNKLSNPPERSEASTYLSLWNVIFQFLWYKSAILPQKDLNPSWETFFLAWRPCVEWTLFGACLTAPHTISDIQLAFPGPLWSTLVPLCSFLILATLLRHIPQEEITAELGASPQPGLQARCHRENRKWIQAVHSAGTGNCTGYLSFAVLSEAYKVKWYWNSV